MEQTWKRRAGGARTGWRHGALVIAVVTLAACGGGGGGGSGPAPTATPGTQVAVDDPDGLTEAVAVAVGDSLANKVTGAPPGPSGPGIADAPVASADVSSTGVRAGDGVAVPLTVRSSSAIDRLFAKIPGAASYFELSVPAGGKSAVVQVRPKATTRKFLINITIPQNVAPGRFCIELSARDADARVSNVAVVCLNVVDPDEPLGNEAPQARGGDDRRELPGATVTLDGGASTDPDGTIVAYAWTQVQGPAVTLQNADTAVASFVAPQVEGVTLSFVLSVTDDAGDAGSASVTILVTTEPAPTVVSFYQAAQTAAETAGAVSVALSINPPPAQDISLTFSVGGTATASDRTVTQSPLTIPAGTFNTSIVVSVINDAASEADETVVLTLSGSTDSELGEQTVHTLTIRDDESTPVPQATLYSIGFGGELIRFSSVATQSATTMEITGIEATGPDNTFPLLLALDFRPATGELYLYTSDRRFYRINTQSAVATLVGTLPPEVTTSELFAVDFDPCRDQIRVIGSNRENFRLGPNVGFVARDPDLSFAAGDVNAPGAPGSVDGIAYTGCAGGATTLYAVDTLLDALLRIGSVGGSPTSADSGQATTVATLDVSIGGAYQIPFDIDPATGIGYLVDGDGFADTLYQLDLQTGRLTTLGIIDDGSGSLGASILAVQP